jgi:CheY-like chemotaxis protein
VFEPFFTTKEVGKGSGLGLAQVYGFAKQSGGGVRIDTVPGEGTTVRVYLPRVAAGFQAAEPALDVVDCSTVRKPGDKPVLLIVDDDSAVREITATKLSEADYEVREASSGLAAIHTLEQDPCFDVVVLDFAMPGMNGAEVAGEIRRRWPSIPVVFVTGYADKSALTGVAGVSEDEIVQKPFLNGELERKVAKAVDARSMPGLRLVSSR